MMEVRGVFMSCETFVISSVLKRSLFMRSFTALFTPSVMLLRFSPCSFNGPRRYFRSTRYPALPAAISRPATSSRFIAASTYITPAASSARSKNQPVRCDDVLPTEAMNINSTSSTPSIISTARGTKGMQRNIYAA